MVVVVVVLPMVNVDSASVISGHNPNLEISFNLGCG
jgi:hypothetical protein